MTQMFHNDDSFFDYITDREEKREFVPGFVTSEGVFLVVQKHNQTNHLSCYFDVQILNFNSEK